MTKFQKNYQKEQATEFFNKAYYEKRYRKGLIFARGDKPFLYNYWIRYFKKHKPKKSLLLDIGCGEGYLCKRSAPYFKTYGLDISIDAVELAGSNAQKTIFGVMSAENGLGFKKDTFDIVVCCDVIEHLENPAACFAEIYRILKPSGITLLSTPNPDSYAKPIQKDKWVHLLDPSHISILPLSNWTSIIENTGFTIRRIGSDFFWDIPYNVPVPKIIQKIILMPLNNIVFGCFGFLPWFKGENLWFLLQKK